MFLICISKDALKQSFHDLSKRRVNKLLNRLRLGNMRDYLVRKFFVIGQNLGVHVLPIYFYSPVPDTRTLGNPWSELTKLVGIDIREKEQLELLSLFISNYKNEYDRFPINRTSNPTEYHVGNTSFGSVDAEILYCMIRYFKPRKILEIGSGYSTLLSAKAILRNKEEDRNYDCELMTIDPYPCELLRNEIPGVTKVISKRVQDIPLSEFQKLRDNDILFIDSTHVLKIGSDVVYEYLEIIPRLKKGVIIHSHDILLPAQYHKKWVLENHFFWNEQYLLQAFLAFNEDFRVIWASSYIHLRHQDRLANAFGSYSKDKNWPVSFWMRRIN